MVLAAVGVAVAGQVVKGMMEKKDKSEPKVSQQSTGDTGRLHHSQPGQHEVGNALAGNNKTVAMNIPADKVGLIAKVLETTA